MLLLGLDTATAQGGVALGDGGGVRACVHLTNAGRHSDTLIPTVEFICRQAGTELRSVTAVAVDVGPGLFTGLRVGVSTAKSIAFAHGIPTIPVSSLEILAYGARLSRRTIVSVIDALSGEVYYASYRAESGGVWQLTEPAVGTPQDLATHVRELTDEVLLVGDGARKYADLFADLSNAEIAAASFQYPSAALLVELAAPRAQREEFVSATDLQIAYLRKPYVHSNE